MSEVKLELVPWTRRRWGWTVGLILVGQFLILGLMANRRPIVPRQPVRGPQLRLLGSDNLSHKLAAQLTVFDPTLFALVSLQGFSGPAWTNRPQASHELTEWNEAPSWTEPRMNRLGLGFAESVFSPAVSSMTMVGKPVPAWTEVALGKRPPLTNSVLRLEGDLAERRLLSPVALPAQTASELLTNSEAQVVVDAVGRVFSATLLQSSGWRDADQSALEVARSLRFQPLSSHNTDLAWSAHGLSCGKVIFQWYSVGSPTNSTSPKP
jgi:hypothetical protein